MFVSIFQIFKEHQICSFRFSSCLAYVYWFLSTHHLFRISFLIFMSLATEQDAISWVGVRHEYTGPKLESIASIDNQEFF